MDSVEASGKSIDDAIVQALARLGRRRDEVDVQVLQESSRGVRGVGSREARVRVWVKRAQPPAAARGQGAILTPDLAAQWIGGLEDDEEPSAPPPAPTPIQRVPSAFRPAQPPPAPTVYDDEDDEEYEDDEEDDDYEDEEDDEDADATLTQPQLAVATPALEDEGQFAGAGPVPDAVGRKALDTLRTLLRYMNLPVTVAISRIDPFTLNINTNGNDDLMGLFIGRRGETLAATQLILNMMVNRKGKDRYHVIVDIERYREHRDDNLRSLALRVAQQVQQTQRPVTLEPMTPYERRIVHMALQDLPNVQTQSTGEGEQRRVVVSLKGPAR